MAEANRFQQLCPICLTVKFANLCLRVVRKDSTVNSTEAPVSILVLTPKMTGFADQRERLREAAHRHPLRKTT